MEEQTKYVTAQDKAQDEELAGSLDAQADEVLRVEAVQAVAIRLAQYALNQADKLGPPEQRVARLFALTISAIPLEICALGLRHFKQVRMQAADVIAAPPVGREEVPLADIPFAESN